MDKSVYQAYEDEIRALEEEIRLLTEKYEDIRQESTFFSDEEILKSIKSFQQETQGETKGQEYPSDLKAELESLGTDLSFFMTLTGFQFTSHSKKTVEKTEKRTVQKHRLSGKCHSLSFQLEFQLLEMQNNEKVSAVVSDLSIVMESREDSDVSKFVSSTEEHGNLLTFFRSLSAYAEWYEHRRRTFLHFKNAAKKRGKERGTDFSCYLAEDPQLNNDRINFVPISSYNQLSLKTIYILKVYIHNFTINLSLKKVIKYFHFLNISVDTSETINMKMGLKNN
ncbi:centromere protein P isoform 2-T3 [Cyanocitta cristata]